jgi:lipopolysaccharide biosynthesis protein
MNGRLARPLRRGREQSIRERIERSGLFDRAWYLRQYPGVLRSGTDPIIDYVRHGAEQGRNPNPLFEGEWYLARHPETGSAGADALVHYIAHGAAAGCDPGPFFDSSVHLARHPDAAATHGNPLAHYLAQGASSRALPFDPARLLNGVKVAVIVHLFYRDLWAEIASRLRSIPIDFDLFVSLAPENADELRALVLRDYPRAQVCRVPNAGRDVGAFLAVLPRVLAGQYSVLCKLHSKKGTQYPDAWRDLLLAGVLANEMLVCRILHAFARDSELALAGAREVYLSGDTHITQNRDQVEAIARLLCPGKAIPGNWGFFAGTMFWARPDFFRPVMECRHRIPRFEGDNTRIDGQVAHALERTFGALAVLQGKRIGLTEITGLGPLEGTIHVMQAPGEPWAGSFGRVLREHALRLNGDLPFTRTLPPLGRARPSTSTRAKIWTRAKAWTARLASPAVLGKPLAHASAELSRLPPPGMLALRLTFWTVTLQIGTRLRAWLLRRRDARLVASSHLFDRDWYLERYPDVGAAGMDPARHYAAHGAAGYRDPGPGFDSAWYLAYYPDVAGVNPLAHYLLYGAKEGRHPKPGDIVIGEVADAQLCCRKCPRAAGETALLVTHSADGRLKPHVRHYLAALARHGVRPVLIVAADGEFRAADAALLALVDGLYIRQNVGYDFAAWAHVLRENRQLLDCDILYLVNDSTIGPLSERKFEELLARVRSSENDVVGLTDSYERGWHIQSYFIALKPAALSSPAFWAFIAKIKNLADKKSVVNTYETRFAPTLQAAGLRCEVLFPTHKSHNPSLMDWRALINSGLPFVKLAALRNSWRSNFWRSNSWRTLGNAGWRKNAWPIENE